MHHTQEQSERGSALVMAIFVLALLTSMGTALLFMSQHEVRMGRAGLHAKQAFYLAEAGIEDGRVTLFVANVNDTLDDELAAAAGADNVIDFDRTLLQVTHDANGNVTSVGGFNDDVPLRSLTMLDSGALNQNGWYAAFLTNDPVDGRSNMTDTNDRVMITAVGALSDDALELVEAIIEPYQYLPEVPAAAITLLGPLPSFDNGDSNAQSHDGTDCDIPGGPYVPIIGTIDADAQSAVQGQMKRPEKFVSGPYGGTGTVGDLTDPADPVVGGSGHGTIDPTWTDCQTLKEMILNLQLSASFYCDSDFELCTIPATTALDEVVFIDGDLTETPSSPHSGILVVTGRLTYSGNTGWDGIILAVGEGYVFRDGGGGGVPSGAVIVAAIDPTPSGPNSDKSDWCDISPDGFGQSTYITDGGGNATVTWCSEDIKNANSVRKYRVVEFVQR